MTLFGTLQDGRDVSAVTIAGHGLSVTVLTYGAILQDVRLDGIGHSLTLGSETLSDYETTMAYHGAIVGPVANRISGARAVIAGIEHMLDPNLDRRHTLHGGRRGVHNRIWDITDHGRTHVELTTHLMDGEAGFPANRTLTAVFEISEGPKLTLSITTQTDAPTLANATNHSYWCLDGSGQMDGHDLHIHADHYLPTNADNFPTGEIADVQNTPFDFREITPLKLGETRFDNTYCLSEQRRPLTECLVLRSTDVTLTVSTTETGIHIYDNCPHYAALAIEAQAWPDAPHHTHFPSIEVTSDAPAVQVTQWKFAAT